MYIAKLKTRYPDYHGKGYYNFIMEDDLERLEFVIERNSHDYMHVKTVETKHKSIESIINQYNTKDKLNNKYFKENLND